MSQEPSKQPAKELKVDTVRDSAQANEPQKDDKTDEQRRLSLKEQMRLCDLPDGVF